MIRRDAQFRLLCLALAVFLSAGAPRAAARQIAKAQKQAAVSQQSTGGSVPLRVGLVISDAVRSYRQTQFLTHFDFGRHLASHVESACNQTFVSVRTMRDLAADPQANSGLDMIIVLEVPEGSYHQAGLITGSLSLTARFTVHDASGAPLFQIQESDTEKGTNANLVMDHLTETVARKFVQDFLMAPRVRNALAPPAPVESKPVIADSAALDSSGLEVPPPPPWPQPAAIQPGSTGKP